MRRSFDVNVGRFREGTPAPNTMAALRRMFIAKLFDGRVATLAALGGADSIVRSASWANRPAEASKCDAYTITAHFGNGSLVRLLYPTAAAVGKLILVSAGHDSETPHSDWKDLPGDAYGAAQHFLGKGFHVLAHSMPCIVPNGGFTAITGDSIAANTGHGSMVASAENSTPSYDAVGPFLEPAVRAITQAIADLSPAHIYCTGISGGGWTTHMLAAIDTRVDRSYPVAGSIPNELRTTGARGDEFGDAEQHIDHNTVYKLIPTQSWNGGLDQWRYIYAMGASGRRQLHCLNNDDPVIGWTVPTAQSGGDRTAAFHAFESNVKSILSADPDGGAYDLNIAASSVHTLLASLTAIDADLRI